MDKISANTPAFFANQISKGKFRLPKHILLLDNLLLKATKRDIKRLIINMPPRHGKSELISKYFPAWYLGNFPNQRIILSSYGSSFAKSWGRRVRDLLIEHGIGIFGIEINSQSKSASEFNILEHDGGMTSVGVGGSITGRGADLLIIDDPVKNAADANSAVIRDKVWDWFQSTAYTRIEPDGIIVIIMTRWHEDDLCSRLQANDEPDFDDTEFTEELSDSCKLFTLNENPKLVISNSFDLNQLNEIEAISSKIVNDNKDKNWLKLVLPALATENDIMGRAVGEPLWPGRFSKEKLLKTKSTIGSYWFNSLYQQAPSSAAGTIFKRTSFRYFYYDDTSKIFDKRICVLESNNNSGRKELIPVHSLAIFATVDLAISTKNSADYTVILVFAVTPANDILVLDVIRDRLEGSKHLDLITGIFYKYKPMLIGIEKSGYQSTLIEMALNKGLPVKSLLPVNDKLIRALPMAARTDEGKVFFESGAAWLADFEEELTAFPNGKHDDQVDAFAYISQMVSSAGSGSVAVLTGIGGRGMR